MPKKNRVKGFFFNSWMTGLDLCIKPQTAHPTHIRCLLMAVNDHWNVPVYPTLNQQLITDQFAWILSSETCLLSKLKSAARGIAVCDLSLPTHCKRKRLDEWPPLARTLMYFYGEWLVQESDNFRRKNSLFSPIRRMF